MGRAVRELAGQISQASSGAVEQSDRAQSTATAMEQMNASVLEVARSAGGAATTTEEAKARAEEGAGIVGEAVTAIDRVQVMARGLTERMTALGKKAEDIGRVITSYSIHYTKLYETCRRTPRATSACRSFSRRASAASTAWPWSTRTCTGPRTFRP